MKFEEDKELSHIEKQTILYFKGHFEVTDMIKDLKVFTAAQYDFGVEHCEFRHVYDYVKKLYFRLKNRNFINSSMEDFLSDMFKWREGSITPVGVIEQMRSEIANMVVQGVMELGDPDFSLLPKYEDKAYPAMPTGTDRMSEEEYLEFMANE